MNSRTPWLGAVILGAVFATSANAQSEIDQLRGCLTIEDSSKERLDCYDGVFPPDPKPKTAACEGGRRLQIPERGGRAVGLFQSLFGAASAAESCSKNCSKGSTVKVSRLVELGLKAKRS